MNILVTILQVIREYGLNDVTNGRWHYTDVCLPAAQYSIVFTYVLGEFLCVLSMSVVYSYCVKTYLI